MRRAAVVLAVLATVPAAAAAASAAPQARIVGGTQAAPDAYPAQAAVDTTGVGACGGTLVARRKVVTAAHCVDVGNVLLGPSEAAPGAVHVGLGSSRRSQARGVAVTTVRMHPAYDPDTSANDVAVLTLAADPPAAAVPAPLADPAVDAGDYEPGDPVRVVGWGRTAEGGASVDDLREVEVPVVADAECNDADSYGGTLVPAVMLCAGLPAGGKDSCQGDSGGPLYAPADGVVKLVGVVSFGDGCARPQKYGVYSELPANALRSWIVGQTGAPPTVAIADPGTATRGRETTLTASTTDAIAVTWDLDADGAFDDATGSTARFTPATAGTVPVRARAVDADAMVAVAERMVTVVAPAGEPANGTTPDGSGNGTSAGTNAPTPTPTAPTPAPPAAAAASPDAALGPAPRSLTRVPALLQIRASGKRALRVKGTVGGLGCAGGQVRVSTYRGARLLGRKVATLGPGCTFAASVAARGRVTLKVRFLGTPTLLPASSTKLRRVPTRT